MMRVKARAEPRDFQEKVVLPGALFLTENNRPTSKQWKGKEYWRKAKGDMGRLYGGVCAYCAIWRSHDARTVDHFIPKSIEPSLAYRWDNFRLASFSMNSNKGTVLVPDLLPENEPEMEDQPEPLLGFVVDYDFLPPSVLPRFMVKVHQDIVGELRWRTGMVLADSERDARALVYADNEAREIRIQVSGSERRDYFATLLFFLRQVNGSFEKLKINERVLLPDDDETDHAPPYKHLRQLEKMGQSHFVPYGAEHSYEVSRLLGSVQPRVETEEQILALLGRIADKLELDDNDVEPSRFLAILEQITDLKPGAFGMSMDVKKGVKLWQKRREKARRSNKLKG